ncbi:MAG: cell wall hydrolase [Eubacteriales bacterium]|nr:cell wall hydrolase [Eubacteriales bacterium]
MTRRIFTVLMVIMLVMCYNFVLATANINSVPISVSVNNQFITAEKETFTYNGVAYAPLRTIADSMGAESVEWNPHNKSAKIMWEGKEIMVTTDSYIILVNGNVRSYSYPAMLHKERLCMPIGITVDLMGGQCNWESATLHMQIYKKGVTPPDNLLYSRGYVEEDVIWLSKIINAESEGESLEGKIAVGNVVLNRVKDEAYPNTIYGVIFDMEHGIQFEPVENGSVYRDPNYDSILAAKLALEGESVVGESLFFCNPVTSKNSWILNNRPLYSMIGNHAFFL